MIGLDIAKNVFQARGVAVTLHSFRRSALPHPSPEPARPLSAQLGEDTSYCLCPLCGKLFVGIYAQHEGDCRLPAPISLNE